MRSAGVVKEVAINLPTLADSMESLGVASPDGGLVNGGCVGRLWGFARHQERGGVNWITHIRRSNSSVDTFGIVGVSSEGRRSASPTTCLR